MIPKPLRDRLTVMKEVDPFLSPFGVVHPFVGGQPALYSITLPVSVLVLPQTPEERRRIEAFTEELLSSWRHLCSQVTCFPRCSTIKKIWPLEGGWVIEDQGFWAPTLRSFIEQGTPDEVIATVLGDIGRLLEELQQAIGLQHGFLCEETILVSLVDGHALLSDWQIPASLSPRSHLAVLADRQGDQPWPDEAAYRRMTGRYPPVLLPVAAEDVLRHARGAKVWPADHPEA